VEDAIFHELLEVVNVRPRYFPTYVLLPIISHSRAEEFLCVVRQEFRERVPDEVVNIAVAYDEGIDEIPKAVIGVLDGGVTQDILEETGNYNLWTSEALSQEGDEIFYRGIRIVAASEDVLSFRCFDGIRQEGTFVGVGETTGAGAQGGSEERLEVSPI